MDPLTAIGLASSVVQLVDFGLKIARRLSDYNNARPKEVPKSLQSINSQLPLLLHSLSRLKAETEVEKIDLDTKCLLRGVIAGCTSLVEEVEGIINKLSSVPGEAFGVRVRKVLSSIKNDEKIQALDRNLQTYIQVLILHHVVDAADFPPAAPEEVSYFEVHEKRASPFVERDSVMKELETKLYDAARSLTKTPTVVLLSGGEGSGKTQIALEYCHQSNALGHLRTVFWINAATQENLCLGLESIAATVHQSTEGSRTEKIDFLQKFFANRWHPWLLVLHRYEHANFENSIMEYLPNRGHGAMIFTTRDVSAHYLGKVIEVPKFLDENRRESLRQSLTNAVEGGDIEKVKDALDAGADVNSMWQEHFLCLSRAVIHGREDIVDMLLKYGANPRIHPEYRSPVRWAAGKGNLSIFRKLLGYDDSIGFVPQLDENNGMMQDAAEGGHIEVLRLLFERRETKINSLGVNRRSALYSAASKGRADVVKLLLEKGANPAPVERPYKEGYNYLEQAASNNHLETVRVLCEHDKKYMNAPGNFGHTALYCAVNYIEAGVTRNVKTGEEVVKLLLEMGADPNADKPDSDSPLHLATLGEIRQKMLQMLLDHGADPLKGLSGGWGYPPLHAAAQNGNVEAFKKLLKIDITDPTLRVKYHETALRYTARKGLREYCLLILELGTVNIDTLEHHTGDEGLTPLHLAIKNNQLQTARLLVRQKASQEIPDQKGRQPILLAAEKGWDLLVKDLLKQRKMPNVRDEDGNTPLCLAAAKGHEKVVKMLLESGADMEAANKFGETALDLAEEKGHEKVVKILEDFEG